ncbi:MBL fold metallo-hydrolase [Thiomicrorhabdus sp.]|uniref:MBL fold metallo-hydrolase n=1 Tax=Thiomicrorhabdus sp. TaxID=2039724 RepID=UPI0029C6B858|nr:MBL fold metallo-hydrolase [Thiomicrorhabdus sp.]
MKNNKIKILISTLALFTGQQSLAAASDDPYTAGLKTYFEEVSQLEKQQGYIGKTLPIPKLKQIAPDVYMSVGSQIWGNRSNFGFNNNMTAVIFPDGVFVYNAGPNEPVAYSFHKQLKRITDKPVKWVAIENYQGHANMGASYWHDIGVKHIYSQEEAAADFNKRFDRHKARYMAASGAEINRHSQNVAKHYTTFKDSMEIDVGGGEKVILVNFGGGHTETMAGAIIPSKKLIFTGDLGFNQRVPGLFAGGNYLEWIASFNKMTDMARSLFKDQLDTAVVVPGHGTAADLATIHKQTIGYFEDVSAKIKKVIDQGGDLQQAKKVDQSAYRDRPVFDQLAESNAEHIYKQMIKQ